jgi:predicted translin family RNA/ssDNA-binding protein
MIYEIPEHQLREVKVKLPKDLVKWLEEIAKARGETIDEVLTWTLGNIFNFYDRWFRAKRRIERAREIANLLDTRLEKFKEYLASRRIKKWDSYYFIARKFVTWLKSKNIDSLDDITYKTIESYLEELNVKTSTKHLYKYYLKKFLSFIEGQTN